MERGTQLEILALPPEWLTTRRTLQAVAQALTALPRAAAPADPRWSHVAMEPTGTGFRAAPTPLADGSQLLSEIDLADHAVRMWVGEQVLEVDLEAGASPRAIGTAALSLAEDHGTSVDVDDERLGTDEILSYDPEMGAAFLASAMSAIAAMERMNEGLEGDVEGPHLWPHGFDIATEWFSDSVVEGESGPANAQIAMGWYPAEESYVYVNPWPFRDEYAAIQLPVGAAWHIEGWFGAKLDLPERGALSIYDAAALGTAVHEATRDTLGR